MRFNGKRLFELSEANILHNALHTPQGPMFHIGCCFGILLGPLVNDALNVLSVVTLKSVEMIYRGHSWVGRLTASLLC